MQKNHCELKACIIIAVVLLASLTFQSCDHPSSSPPSGPDLTWRVPATGSLYVETHYHGTLTAHLQGSGDAHYYIAATGSYAGKPNTVKLDSAEHYIAFESNGDYSVLDSSWGISPADWQRFPTGGGSAISQIRDTIYAPDSLVFFDTTHVHKYATRSYVGVESITDADNDTYATFKIHEVSTEVDSVISYKHASVPTTMTLNTDYWIAPTIGWIVKDSSCDGANWTSKLLAGCTIY